MTYTQEAIEKAKELIKKQGDKAHKHWLQKAETSRIKEGEMTVISYGFLSQAVKKSVKEALLTFIDAEIERKKEMLKPGIEINYEENNMASGYKKAIFEDIAYLEKVKEEINK